MARRTRSRKHRGGQQEPTNNSESMMGGRKSRRHHKCGGARKTARRHHKRGGMFGTLSSIVQSALVPFGLYGAQKWLQRRKKSEKKHLK